MLSALLYQNKGDIMTGERSSAIIWSQDMLDMIRPSERNCVTSVRTSFYFIRIWDKTKWREMIY